MTRYALTRWTGVDHLENEMEDGENNDLIRFGSLNKLNEKQKKTQNLKKKS